jgi:hypothetical protein
MTGAEAAWPSGYQRGEGPGAHERVHLRHVVDAKLIRPVHDGSTLEEVAAGDYRKV